MLQKWYSCESYEITKEITKVKIIQHTVTPATIIPVHCWKKIGMGQHEIVCFRVSLSNSNKKGGQRRRTHSSIFQKHIMTLAKKIFYWIHISSQYRVRTGRQCTVYQNHWHPHHLFSLDIYKNVYLAIPFLINSEFNLYLNWLLVMIKTTSSYYGSVNHWSIDWGSMNVRGSALLGINHFIHVTAPNIAWNVYQGYLTG